MNIKRGLAVTGLCLVCSLGGAIASQLFLGNSAWAQNDTLRTQRLEIVDSEGKLRAVFTALRSSNAPVLTMVHKSGKPGLTLAINPDNSMAVVLADANGKMRGSLVMGANQEVYVQRYDLEGNVTQQWPETKPPVN